jgi:prepilin-type processing-associated H-X9-DG protein
MPTAAVVKRVVYSDGTDITNLVPKTTTVNGHALSGNVAVTVADLGLTPVYCEAFLTADQTGFNPNASSVKVLIDTVKYDSNTAFNTTDKRYVFPLTGYYLINAQVTFLPTNVLAASYYISFYYDGAYVYQGQRLVPPVGTAFSVSGTFILNATATHYLEIYVTGVGNNGTNTLTVDGHATVLLTYMTITKIA